MAESKKLQVVEGQKVEGTPVEAKTGKGHKPDSAEVGGRTAYERVLCWNCYAVNVVYVDPVLYLYYNCWNCRSVFRV
jgi:hypothetical protein